VNRRIVIDRLDLDLRGVDPEVAQQAVRLLGPALQSALARQAAPAAPESTGQPDAVGAPGTAFELAGALAQRIACRVGRATPEG
jgi:hypothetical protein